MHYASFPGLNSVLGRWYLNRRMNYLKKHLCGIGHVSCNSQNVFSTRHPDYPKEKLYYVYNGIPELPFSHNKQIDDVIRFICVGSLSDRKNQKALIEAMTLLKPTLRDKMQLILVGDGEVRTDLELLAKQNNLTNVIFMGSCTNVPELLKAADVFILASKDEGLPISIIEAMREGLPIIGSRVAGIPEQIIEGRSGYVIGTTASSVADAYAEMLSKTKDELAVMGRESYNLFLEKFTEDSMFNKYMHVFTDAIQAENL